MSESERDKRRRDGLVDTITDSTRVPAPKGSRSEALASAISELAKEARAGVESADINAKLMVQHGRAMRFAMVLFVLALVVLRVLDAWWSYRSYAAMHKKMDGVVTIANVAEGRLANVEDAVETISAAVVSKADADIAVVETASGAETVLPAEDVIRAQLRAQSYALQAKHKVARDSADRNDARGEYEVLRMKADAVGLALPSLPPDAATEPHPPTKK